MYPRPPCAWLSPWGRKWALPFTRLLPESVSAYRFAPKAAPAAASHSNPIQLCRCDNHEGASMANLEIALQQLREERSRTQLQVETLDQAISVIESLNRTGVSRRSSRPTRIVSAVSRRRMAQAQRARWAKTKGRAPKPKRTISPAGRKRIAAAQRARWAKIGRGRGRLVRL